MKCEIRKVRPEDVDELTAFFVKAYGSNTIFQNPDFLRWYFNSKQNDTVFMPECIVAVDEVGRIISHYGGLNYTLQLRSELIPIVWGVNAFTLHEWRGQGINSRIVELLGENEINGVIGFTPKTASFYDSIGYHVFDFARFARYILIIDEEKTREVVNYIGQNFEVCGTRGRFQHNEQSFRHPSVFELNNSQMQEYNFEFSVDVEAATLRDRKFLDWRFARNPFIDYKLYGFVTGGAVSAYMAVRKETLSPLKYQVNRIVDMYGTPDQIHHLLDHVKQQSLVDVCIYIDFSMMGAIYDRELLNAGFARLDNEDAAVLPQVTNPVANRPNSEYVGLKSRTHQQQILSLRPETVYFTRLDSDRDRRA